jgi:hypothetical protein
MTQDTSSYTDLTTKNPFVLTLLTAPGSAALRIENSELPAAIQVDETQHREVARRRASCPYPWSPQPAVDAVADHRLRRGRAAVVLVRRMLLRQKSSGPAPASVSHPVNRRASVPVRQHRHYQPDKINLTQRGAVEITAIGDPGGSA